MINKDTYTFKTIDDCEIKANVHSLSSEELHPAIMWMHGGALIFGNRNWIPPEQVEMYVNAGFTLVSVDHRLAPETKLTNIVGDVQDAYYWIRDKGPQLFNIDPNRIAVIGSSAGGYLSLMTGFCVNPRPFALVSFYGYGDISGTWYSHPSEYYCQQPLVSKEEAYQTVGDSAISYAPTQSERRRFYHYCRQNGLWPYEVTGHDPDNDINFFRPYCPIQNITRDYPPTLLLHGDADTDVPYEQSLIMANELAKYSEVHEFISIPGGGHMFDLAGIDEPLVAHAFKRVIAFLNRHVS